MAGGCGISSLTPVTVWFSDFSYEVIKMKMENRDTFVNHGDNMDLRLLDRKIQKVT